MTTPAPLRVGTRGSPLALWQTTQVCDALARTGVATEVVIIKTTGDVVTDLPFQQINDPAMFTRQIDEAMLEGRIDLAVHSLKDLPTILPAGIEVVAIGERADPRDALITRTGGGFETLPRGAKVATSSLRRRAQLLRARPDLEVVETRGNVDTRLKKLEREPDVAATLLAVAGLVRLGLEARICDRMPYGVMLPAPGQAAMAVTARTGHVAAAQPAERAMHDPVTAACVTAERALLRALDGGCEVPVAALAELVQPASSVWRRSPGVLRLRARVVSVDGTQCVEGQLAEPVGDLTHATELGQRLAARLVAEGAAQILEALRSPSAKGG